MGIQIADLCGESIFQNDFLVAAGYDGLCNEFSYISVIDTPLIPKPDYMLESGVFVLSSFFLYKDDPELLAQAIENLISIGASAIGVKTDLFLQHIPESVIDICNRSAIPLFVTNNKNLPFRKVISIVENLVSQHENSSYFLSGVLCDNVQSVFYKVAAECITVNFVCVSASLDTLLRYSPNSVPACDALEEKARSYLTEIAESGAVLPSGGYAYIDTCYYFPCYVYGVLEAIMVFEYPAQLSDYKAGQIRQLTTIFSLELKENILIEKGKQAAYINQSNNYLLREYNSEVEARIRFELLGFPNGASYRLFLFSFCPDAQKPSSFFSSLNRECSLKKEISSIFPNTVFLSSSDAMVCLVPVFSSSKLCVDSNVEAALVPILSAYKSQMGFRILFSELQTNLSEIRTIYQHILQYAKISSMPYSDSYIEKVRNFDFISVMSSMSNVNKQTVYKSIISPLLEADQQYHGDLWLTLAECLKTDKLEAAANKLHIHSSTLRYRLQKIENITGYSFFVFKDKVALYAAYLQYCADQI